MGAGLPSPRATAIGVAPIDYPALTVAPKCYWVMRFLLPASEKVTEAPCRPGRCCTKLGKCDLTSVKAIAQVKVGFV